MKENSYVDTFVLTLFDGCGNPLEKFTFIIQGINELSFELDYASSEEVSPFVESNFTFSTRERIIEQPKDKFECIACFKNKHEGLVYGGKIKLKERPKLQIEEIKINYLHGAMWIPGKSRWEPLTFEFNEELYDNRGFSRKLTNNCTDCDILLYKNGCLAESWQLTGVVVEAANHPSYTLRFSDASYKDFPKT